MFVSWKVVLIAVILIQFICGLSEVEDLCLEKFDDNVFVICMLIL